MIVDMVKSPSGEGTTFNHLFYVLIEAVVIVIRVGMKRVIGAEEQVAQAKWGVLAFGLGGAHEGGRRRSPHQRTFAHVRKKQRLG